jgi:type IV pilus assembly protein PilW
MVELLVGLVIALLGSLAIMQIFTVSEGGRRATGALADVQSNLLIGMFSIERDLQQAGMGLANSRALGCIVKANTAPFDKLNDKVLAPAAIIPAGEAAGSADNIWGIPPGDADSDMLVVAYSTAANMAEGTPLTRADAGSPFRLTNVLGIAINDAMLVAQSERECSLGPVQAVNVGTEEVTLSNASGVAYTTAAYAFDLGATPRLVVYAVRDGNLTMCDFMQADCTDAGMTGDPDVWQPLSNDVVALVAHYAWDTSTPPDMIADTFCKSRLIGGGACPDPDDGTPAAGNTGGLTQTQRACDWTRIPAIRIGLVARSGQYEKEEVSPDTLTLWPDSAVAPTAVGPTWPVADRHYRYRTAYTTVALRNMIWMGAQTSCP